ncbi:MAG TPA: hypothetical protein VLJ37_08090 [bacterium]|nr:hypothetical protein [bacterium]
MSFESQKILFQIYREGGFNRRYRVVYFTELGDKNKETEINRALAGDPVYDGFIKDFRKDEAKAIIERYLDELNGGAAFNSEKFQADLKSYMPS